MNSISDLECINTPVARSTCTLWLHSTCALWFCLLSRVPQPADRPGEADLPRAAAGHQRDRVRRDSDGRLGAEWTGGTLHTDTQPAQHQTGLYSTQPAQNQTGFLSLYSFCVSASCGWDLVHVLECSPDLIKISADCSKYICRFPYTDAQLAQLLVKQIVNRRGGGGGSFSSVGKVLTWFV